MLGWHTSELHLWRVFGGLLLLNNGEMLKSHSLNCTWGNEILVKSCILDLQEGKEKRKKFCSVRRKAGKVGKKVLLVTVTTTEGS